MHTPYLALYDSSKAAITMASDTVRLGLKPLGTNVISAMVGMVESKYHDNLEEPQFKPDSHYKPAEKWIKMSSTPGQGTVSQYEMSQEKFWVNMVNDILTSKSGKVWRGGRPTVSRLTMAVTELGSGSFSGPSKSNYKLIPAFSITSLSLDEVWINYPDQRDNKGTTQPQTEYNHRRTLLQQCLHRIAI